MDKCTVARILFCGLFFILFLHVNVRIAWDKVKRTENTHTHSEVGKALDVWNRNKIDYDTGLRAEFERLWSKELESNDKDLVALVKKMLDPPSEHGMRKPVHTIFQTPQAKAVDDLFHAQVSAGDT